MTHAQSDTGSDGLAKDLQCKTIERELAVEQAHVIVYARLAEATRCAQRVARAGRSLYQSTAPPSYARWHRLYERTSFAFQAAGDWRYSLLSKRVWSSADGPTDGEIRYVGRIGVRDAEYEPLVIDWRAGSRPFYRATPSNPMGDRRRVLHSRGDRVVGIEGDLWTAKRRWSGDRRRVAAGGIEPGP